MTDRYEVRLKSIAASKPLLRERERDGVGMVQDHTDSERGNPLPPLHGLPFFK